MADEGFKRKLSAILSTDAVGYSRLMRDDEDKTILTLTAYRSAIANLVQKFRGRVVDATGDNLLAVFSSVVDAVNCGVEIQRELAERNAGLSDERKMEFRIGINLGDVVETAGRVYGDGVNIAARMESLAEPGGICISGSVHDSVESRLGLGFEYLGEQEVKNIEKPVRAYRVSSQPAAAANRVVQVKKPLGRRRQNIGLLAAVALVLIGGLAFWQHYLRRSSVEPASEDKMAYPLPDKPSIAVLPFVNMSDDSKQEYFSDGITEDLITDLSTLSSLFVVARNSTFVYKGKPVKIRQVAEELGVRYVLEGSVRKANNKIRINAQLIDAITGHHVWAKRYDGEIGDVFALQDKITSKIVAALAVRLNPAEQKPVSFQDTQNVNAYDDFLQGWAHYRRHTPDDWSKAISYFKKAVALDPGYSRAYAAMALIYWKSTKTADAGMTAKLAVGGNFHEATLRARENLELAMKKPSSISYQVGALMYLYRRQYAKAITEAERSISLDENSTDNLFTLAYVLTAAGRANAAVEIINRGMRRDPHNIAQALYLLGMVHFVQGQFEDVVTSIERALKHNPALPRYAPILPAAYAHLGQEPKARAALEDYKKGFKNIFTIATVLNWYFPFKEPEVLDRLAEGLRKIELLLPPGGYYNYFQDNELTATEIKELVFGRKITGFKLRAEYWIERSSNGIAVYRVAPGTRADNNDRGTSWIEDDMLCDRWQFHRFGQKECMAVFRNPKWTPDKKNRYLGISDYEIFAFSPVD